jgi:hypothetical protein
LGSGTANQPLDLFFLKKKKKNRLVQWLIDNVISAK